MATMALFFGLLGAALPPAGAQGVRVSLQVSVESPKSAHKGAKSTMPSMAMPQAGPDTVVAWLRPMGVAEATTHHAPMPAHSFVLSQKNKQFTPHLLVIPTGSSVEFPNLDPFFHNVFSLFNGRRFDLGLYEAGSRRSVRFDHEGVSYIFCNIHPEMGAVIVSLSTPYYAVSSADGSLNLTNVPPGDYELNLWSQNVSSADSAAATQRIHVAAQDLRLSTVVLRSTPSPLNHLNKFGDPYKKPDQGPY